MQTQDNKLQVSRPMSDGGFTLIEVLVSMFIFSIAILGLAVGATSVMRANQTALYATIATNLAQDKLEELKGRPASISTCNSNCENPKPTFNNVAFTRTWTVTADSPTAGVNKIDVQVQWTDYIAHSLTVSSAVKP